ncbi:MAG: helix-turn-helix domain-containing protein [Nitrospinota bacterium]
MSVPKNKKFNPNRITALRELHALNQSAFARRLRKGIQRQHVNNWELGISRPSIASLENIANTFKVNMDYFF